MIGGLIITDPGIITGTILSLLLQTEVLPAGGTGHDAGQGGAHHLVFVQRLQTCQITSGDFSIAESLDALPFMNTRRKSTTKKFRSANIFRDHTIRISRQPIGEDFVHSGLRQDHLNPMDFDSHVSTIGLHHGDQRSVLGNEKAVIMVQPETPHDVVKYVAAQLGGTNLLTNLLRNTGALE